MRSIAALFLGWAAVGCGGGGDDGPPVVFDEVCDNGADDDSDGLTDCEDGDCAGFAGCDTGTPATTTTGGPTTPSTPTGVTSPASPLEIYLDANYDFQHEMGLTQCPQDIGRIQLNNTTNELAQILVYADDVQGVEPLFFEMEGEPTGINPWVEWPVPAQSGRTVIVYYSCNATSSFNAVMRTDFTQSGTGGAENHAISIVGATIL